MRGEHRSLPDATRICDRVADLSALRYNHGPDRAGLHRRAFDFGSACAQGNHCDGQQIVADALGRVLQPRLIQSSLAAVVSTGENR